MTAGTVVEAGPSWRLPGAKVVIPAANLDDRDAWLAARRTGVTATDARVLAGHGYASESVFGRWLEKVEPEDAPDGDEDTPLAWELGHDFEPIIRKHAARHFDTEFRAVGLLRSKVAGHLLASPDWNTADGGLGEGKSTSSWYLRDHFDPADEYTNDDGHTLPAAWRVQALHQLSVSGRSHVHVCALLVDRRQFTFWTVEPDTTEQGILRVLADEFWSHVVEQTPPPVDFNHLTESEIRKRWPSADADRVVVDDPAAVLRLIRDRATFKAEAKDLDANLAAVEGELKSIAADAAEVVDAAGKVLFRWGNRSRKGVDTARLFADHPELADEYTTQSSFRALGGFSKVAI